MTKKYIEKEKQIARNESLQFAIKTLTKKRHKSTIARKTYVRDIKTYLIENGTVHDKELASLLDESEILRWESFYESIIRKKKPSELRVAYLSGPNPENDIEVLVENGILAENIWAFESDNITYTTAVVSALDSKFPFVKLYKGKLENYLKVLPFKFDIIYLDFCGTVVSDSTLSVVRDIFLFQKLETLGVLITNFALPSEKYPANIDIRKNINLLTANYLYPKPFTEEYSNFGGGFRESAECHNISQNKFLSIAKRNIKTFYSQFITRILYDLPSVIIPYQRLASNEQLTKLFFKSFNKSSFNEDYTEDLYTFPDQHPLIWGLSDFFIRTKPFNDILEKFKKQISITGNASTVFDSIEKVSYFMEERSQDGLHSDKLDEIRKSWKITDKYIFCDVFMFHQLKDILIGQVTSPYFYNVDYTKRWTYKAKETDMFMDLITYDECRYIFDWMPTLDMFEDGVNDIHRQLSLRFAMDSVTKQRRWYNEEFFSGTAVVDQGAPSFEAKQLKKRKTIKLK
jgi:hypothetical protein